MDLVLMRHGPAGSADFSQWPNDHDRPLTPEGQSRVRRAAHALGVMDVHPTHVFASPAARAWATATTVCEALQLPAPEAWPELLPEAPAEPIAARLLGVGHGTALVVGHEPTLVHLAGLLLTGRPGGLPCTWRRPGSSGCGCAPGAPPSFVTSSPSGCSGPARPESPRPFRRTPAASA